jgi:hypothetical protein
MALHIS